MRNYIKLVCCFLLLGAVSQAYAQVNDINIVLKANTEDWLYKVNDTAYLDVKVKQGNKNLKDIPFTYEVGLENMKPSLTGTATLTDSVFRLKLGTLNEPGFLRCVINVTYNGKKYRELATMGFNVDDIKPTTTLPKDFMEFWKSAIKEVRKIPLDVKMEKMEARSTATVDVYEISFQNTDSSRTYGALSIPKKEGKYPVVLKVPGAGARAYLGDKLLADKGFIVLQLGIHGIPISKPDEFYNQLARTKLYGYPNFNQNDKDRYYYKRVFLGCVKAIDFIQTLPQYDGKNLAVAGGSQGGALAVVTTALDKRVKCLVSYFPALSDITGYLFNRTGGWPHTLRNPNNVKDDNIINTSKYYDAVNFARYIKVPGFYSWGYNDETCPPTTSYALYNTIKAKKEKFIEKESGHKYTKKQLQLMDDWLIKYLKK